MALLLQKMNGERGEFFLEATGEALKFGKETKIGKAGIDSKERPAGKAAFDATLQPLHGLRGVSQYRMNSRKLVVRVMRVSERIGEAAGPLGAVQGGTRVAAEGLQKAFHGDEKRLAREPF